MLTILNFHGIGDAPGHVEPGEGKYWISQAFFHRILDLVIDHGQTADVEITFDDGNMSDLECGVPALKDRNLTASFFVLSGRLDTPGYLSSADLTTMLREGMTIGTHGCDHVDWRTLDEERLTREICTSREVIAAACGRPVDTVAIPFGAYNGRVIRRLKAAGYERIYTSDTGPANGASRVQARTSIRSDMSLQDVERILSDRVSWKRKLRRTLAGILKRTL